MPRITRSSIGRRTRYAQRIREVRTNLTPEQREEIRTQDRLRLTTQRETQSEQQQSQRAADALARRRVLRNRLTDSNRNLAQLTNRVRMQAARTLTLSSFHRVAFDYQPDIEYSAHTKINIGEMDKVCTHCNALKFKHETPGMCCASGKVVLPTLQMPPDPLATLFAGITPESKQFLKKLRRFNSCFQMTSFAAKIINPTYGRGRNFESTFKIQGQVYHQIGSLLPMPNDSHKFLQIYFMGNEEAQVDIRCHYNHIEAVQERAIVATLETFLAQHNELIKLFKSMSNRLENDNYMIVIKPDKVPAGEHARRFNAPTVNEVGILMVGDAFENRDIRIMRRNDSLQVIPDTHRSYDALQYPLLFWQGEDGYHINIKQVNPATGQDTNKKVSAMSFYAFRLMIRLNTENHILKCRQLFHQYIVDMYAKIESERLRFIRHNQSKLRAEEYIHLRDAINNNNDSNLNINQIGNMCILPSSYTGSPRHMQEYIQDAMAYVRAYGRPDLFLTFTCNPQWEEIQKYLLPGQVASDRHDITARVFKQKLKSFIDFIVKHHAFGETRCWMYSIEWQKRGLPHSHILIWLNEKIRPEEIDSIISAEIPDRNVDPVLFLIVTSNMIHGPCGQHNNNSPCMDNGKCTKRFPKNLLSHTITGIDGYPLYRRRSTQDGGHSFILPARHHQSHAIEIDNRWVVPYSPILTKTFNAHINVEYCSSVKSIKYICKYVHKGSDMAVFGVQSMNENDEIARYQMGRYISSNEAVWRILGFPIHERDPAVYHLAIHLENGQRVYFNEQNAAQRAFEPPKTTLTEFFNLCQQQNNFGQFARTLLYSNVPTYFTWNKPRKSWEPRKRGTPFPDQPGIYSTNVLGRLYTVHPKQRECFYLRLLLINVPGPTSFECLKTVNGQLHDTYHDACKALQLLEGDTHWDTTIADAALSSSPHQIRALFAIILTTCFPTNPKEIWEKYKDSMSEDILHAQRTLSGDPHMLFNEDIYNDSLTRIEDHCILINNEPLIRLGMPSPNRLASDLFNREMQREQLYDTDTLNEYVQINEQKMLPEQKAIYDRIMLAIAAEEGGFFFLDAPGGTGKTFLISLILAKIRSQRNIALAIASSGIAATLLDGGRTAHSALKLPLNIQTNENAVCNIKPHSSMANVLQKCQIIIWDECTMAHKHSLEALDRTMKDLKGNVRIFGGALLLLSGDFRQTLPVIPRSTYADEINACLKSSSLWRSVVKLQLHTNMRVQLQNDPSAARFSEQLLDIGNGKMPINAITQTIKFPEDFCNIVSSRDELIENVFPNIHTNINSHQWLSERAILAAKNVDVDAINVYVQNMLQNETLTFKSMDTVVDENDGVNYPTEFLNSLDLPGLPPHILQLKIGSPIILLRNLNAPKLCNGTRLVIRKMFGNVIEATIITGKFKGEHVLIPRIPMIPTDAPIQFKRLQFPVRLAFAITINKAQGQSMQICGLDLDNACFSHGQLYVACSRVGKPNDLFIYTTNGETKNIVHQLALQ